MIIKEAVLRSLLEIQGLATYTEVLDYIKKQKYYDFGDAKTPWASVSAELGEFIRSGDSRVKRLKKPEGGGYHYYHTSNESLIGLDVLSGDVAVSDVSDKKKPQDKVAPVAVIGYDERDLHMLLVTYLKSTNVYAKTIFHEQSTGADSNQTWTHPDVVGVRFLNLQTKESQDFLKVVNRGDTFKTSSYEIKKEINSDSELKKAFFQAVSNSSWANYGYLVAFEISESLSEEIERLNQSFGIGVIELHANPYQSKVLYQARYRDMDFKTIDKLCKMNKNFQKFIEQTEKLLTAEARYYESTANELTTFCDKFLANDADALQYCKDKHIPVEEE